MSFEPFQKRGKFSIIFLIFDNIQNIRFDVFLKRWQIEITMKRLINVKSLQKQFFRKIKQEIGIVSRIR